MDYTSNNDIIRNIDKVIKMGKEWLETEYIINKRPMSSIAKELDVYQIDVSKALKFFGLPARATCNGKDKSDIEKSMKLLQNYEWLYEKYYIDQLSITHISSNLLHLPPHKIRTQLNEFDIPIRSYSEQLSISSKRRANMEEIKKEFSDRFTELWKDPGFREKMSHRVFPKGKDHHLYGKIWTEEQKQKLRGRKGHPPGPSYNAYKSKGTWYTKIDGNNIWLRSSYEIRVATMLDKLGILWEYESKTFDIPELNTTYRPDFYLPELDMWWEVKGWMHEKAKQKLEVFFVKYSNINLQIIREEDIIDLESFPIYTDLYEIILLGNHIL